MKKRIGILFAMTILIGIPVVVKASESHVIDEGNIKSYGSIIYEDANGSVRIYAEDIALLQGKLASIPDEIFDPVLYSHTHVWEYVDITEQGHTKHCNICGSKYDVVSQHIADEKKECMISYDGKMYHGYKKICECGYQWEEEIYHNLIFKSKDETYHTISCALAGTSYCEGFDIKDTAHEMILKPLDESHHQNICGDCGYQGAIEECVFEVVEDMDEELDPKEKYCECGNYVLEPETDAENPDVMDPETMVTENETNEEPQYEFEKSEKQPIISNSVQSPAISVSGNSIENGVSDMEIIEKEGED